MLLNYNGLANSAGIYVIFNNHNWRIYVGSSKRFKTRWQQGHINSLLSNKHSNKFLQADFNKCKELLGHDDFLEFHVIEDMPGSSRDQRLETEEKWIAVHFDKGEQCYNLCDRAISREGLASKDPQATFEKKSKSQKLSWKLNRDKIVTRMKEVANTPEMKTMASKRAKKTWESGAMNNREQPDYHREKSSQYWHSVWNDEQAKEEILAKRKASLPKQVSSLLANEHFLKNTTEANRKRAKYWGKVTSPTGEILDVVNLKLFCEIHGLSLVSMKLVMSGRQPIHRGWFLPQN